MKASSGLSEKPIGMDNFQYAAAEGFVSPLAQQLNRWVNAQQRVFEAVIRMYQANPDIPVTRGEAAFMLQLVREHVKATGHFVFHLVKNRMDEELDAQEWADVAEQLDMLDKMLDQLEST